MIRNETEYQKRQSVLPGTQRLVEHKASETAGLAEEEIKRVIDRSSPFHSAQGRGGELRKLKRENLTSLITFVDWGTAVSIRIAQAFTERLQETYVR